MSRTAYGAVNHQHVTPCLLFVFLGVTNRLWSCKSSARNPLLECLNLSLGLHAAEPEGRGEGGEVGSGEEGEGGEGGRGFWSIPEIPAIPAIPANCAMRPAAALILSRSLLTLFCLCTRGPLPARSRPSYTRSLSRSLLTLFCLCTRGPLPARSRPSYTRSLSRSLLTLFCLCTRGPLPARSRPWEHCSRCLENEMVFIHIYTSIRYKIYIYMYVCMYIYI